MYVFISQEIRGKNLGIGSGNFAECYSFGTRPQRTLGQSDNLPSVTPLALGKDIYSPSASKDTRQNQTERPAGSCYGFFAECHILDTRHTLDLPSVYITALGKSRVCRVSLFCRVFNCLHSVKGSFAECSNFGTRQSRRHSANIGFPVVHSEYERR